MKNMKAMDFVPTTVIGTAFILLAIYLWRTKNLQMLIGMQVTQIKKPLLQVATNSAYFLLGIGILTVLLPISEQTSGLLLALHLIVILISVLSLVVYIQKQKK